MRVAGPVQSFFKNERDYERAVRLLAGFMDGRDRVCANQAVAYLSDNAAGYINCNHIAEIVMRDRRFMLNGEAELRTRNSTAVSPPGTLWFGTTSGMAGRFLRNGASSRTKGYVKVHDTPEAAKEHSGKFARGGEDCVALEVDAASMKGSRFTSYEDGEYCVREIPAKCFKKRREECEG